MYYSVRFTCTAGMRIIGAERNLRSDGWIPVFYKSQPNPFLGCNVNVYACVLVDKTKLGQEDFLETASTSIFKDDIIGELMRLVRSLRIRKTKAEWFYASQNMYNIADIERHAEWTKDHTARLARTKGSVKNFVAVTVGTVCEILSKSLTQSWCVGTSADLSGTKIKHLFSFLEVINVDRICPTAGCL